MSGLAALRPKTSGYFAGVKKESAPTAAQRGIKTAPAPRRRRFLHVAGRPQKNTVWSEQASPVKPSKQLQVPVPESQVPRLEHSACSAYCCVPR